MAEQDSRADDGMRDLDVLLDGIAQHIADSPAKPPTSSAPLYRAVTRFWPRAAVGLVAVVALVDLVIGGLTADSRIEFYLLAWATITGALWFLFEKLERLASIGTRTEMSARLLRLDGSVPMRSWPDSFVAVFDRVFGPRHISWTCLRRSCVVSMASVGVITLIYWALFPGIASTGDYILLIAGAVTINLLADYLSLMETRYVLRWIKRDALWVTVCAVLAVDLLVTGNIWLMTINAVPELTSEVISVIRGKGWDLIGPAAESWGLRDWAAWWWRRFEDDFLHPPANGEVWATHILFLSTFFTSVWLWLHALAVIGSRSLLRLNSGVGFLLRVTDVERQPFRSVGFVSVIIVSALFALGLPLVLG